MEAKQIKQMLREQYPWRIELHAHTNPVSSCSEFVPEELVRTYWDRGFHGMVLTNHMALGRLSDSKDRTLKMYMEDYERAQKAGEKLGFSVYLGVELCFKGSANDYLVYGLDEDLLGTCYDYLDKGVAAFRAEVDLKNSVFLQAHPFRNGMTLCQPELLDGIECLNLHPNHNSRVALATRYGYEQDFPIKIAGSDCHHPGQEALTALRTRAMPGDSFEVARILKQGDYIFDIGDGSLWLP